MKTPITKLSEAAESGIITTSPELWNEWKNTMEKSFKIEIMKAIKFGQDNPPVSIYNNIVKCNEYFNKTYNK